MKSHVVVQCAVTISTSYRFQDEANYRLPVLEIIRASTALDFSVMAGAHNYSVEDCLRCTILSIRLQDSAALS